MVGYTFDYNMRQNEKRTKMIWGAVSISASIHVQIMGDIIIQNFHLKNTVPIVNYNIS